MESMNIYKKVSNSELIKCFRIQNKVELGKWIEIAIDYEKNRFSCQKLICEKLSDEWIDNNDYTFPSSLLNEFIREANYIEEEKPGDNK